MRDLRRCLVDGRRSPRGGVGLLGASIASRTVGRAVCASWGQSRSLTVLGLATLGSGAACIASDVVQLSRVPPDQRVTGYKAPQYWLDYRDGFVRRAFPGAVLSALTGGLPTHRQVTTTGVGLSLTAAAVVVPLAVRAARSAPDEVGGLLAAGTVLSSPLTASLLLQDVGRFDAVGVLALGALSCPVSTWERLPCSTAVPAVAGLLALAAATQEFLLGPLAPLAVVRARSLAACCGGGPARTALLLVGVLAPGAGVTVASGLLSPPAGAAASARRRARAQGVPPPDQFGDALSAVERDVIGNRAFFEHFTPRAVARALVLWVGVFAVTVAVLSRLLGVAGRRYWWQVAYQAGVATALSVLGTDFRRWWGLGLLGLVGAVTAEPAPVDPLVTPLVRSSRLRSAAWAVAGLASLNVRVRRLTVYPQGRTAPAGGPS